MKKRKGKRKWFDRGEDEKKKMVTMSDSKYPVFYCTVCKIKTWLFHIHEGGRVNTSKTQEKVRGPQDTTRVTCQ